MAEVLLSIKVVPGASADQVCGMLGDRLKVRVAAVPESGKANKALCRFLARSIGVKGAAVEVVSGLTNPEKVVRVVGSGFLTAEDLIEHLVSG